jgi:ParB-like chromosome segregation protein Spo0J
MTDIKAVKHGKKEVSELASRLEQLAIEYVPIDSIEPNSYNPNRQSQRDFELLKRSMREDGFDQPVLVQRATNQIVDGEHRWRAARELSVECTACEAPLDAHPETCTVAKARRGFDPIPVVFVDMSAEQMRISTLRHNRARGSEDYELSNALLRDLRELGALDWAQDSLMLDDKEIARLLDDSPVPEVLSSYEFGEAWEPLDKQEQGAPTVQANVVLTDSRGQDLAVPVVEAASPEAAERIAAAEALLQQEGTNLTKHQRQTITWSREVFKLSMTFSGEEARVVRQVLGDTPAVAVVELCRAVKNQMDPAEWAEREIAARLPYQGKQGSDAQEDARRKREAIADGQIPKWDNERDNLGMLVKDKA